MENSAAIANEVMPFDWKTFWGLLWIEVAIIFKAAFLLMTIMILEEKLRLVYTMLWSVEILSVMFLCVVLVMEMRIWTKYYVRILAAG
jgi:hypothetical protein